MLRDNADMRKVLLLGAPLRQGALLTTILSTIRECVEVTSKKFKLTNKYKLKDVQKLIANIRCAVDERLGTFTQVLLPAFDDASLDLANMRFAEMQAEIHSVIKNSSFQRILRLTLNSAFSALDTSLTARFAKIRTKQVGFPQIVITVINLGKKDIMPTRVVSDAGSDASTNPAPHPIIDAIEEIPSIDELCKVIYLPVFTSTPGNLDDEIPTDLSAILKMFQ